MARQKLKRFAENKLRSNIIEPSKEIFNKIKGHWNDMHFNDSQPITLELACGRGEYSLGMARLFPSRNFVGVDVKGERIWKGSSMAMEEGLENVSFLRANILNLDEFFTENEVEEIWITFPDPRPKKGDAKRRITHHRYLDIYKRILGKNGTVRLKTDSSLFFDYTLDLLQSERDDIKELIFTNEVYNSQWKDEVFDIQTRYEEKFTAKGHKIKYLRFQFEK